jgi:hypothetical protein
MEIDLKRCVPAKRVSADKWDSLEHGECVIVTSREGDAVTGYVAACPGCGQPLSLDFARERPEHPQWSVTAGDPLQPESVTLSPSILHDPAKGACGWHGYLRNGVFEPC